MYPHCLTIVKLKAFPKPEVIHLLVTLSKILVLLQLIGVSYLLQWRQSFTPLCFLPSLPLHPMYVYTYQPSSVYDWTHKHKLLHPLLTCHCSLNFQRMLTQNRRRTRWYLLKWLHSVFFPFPFPLLLPIIASSTSLPEFERKPFHSHI